MGSSKPWPEAMKVMTGSEKLDATAFISYFQPLMDFLDKEVSVEFSVELNLLQLN